MPRSRDVSADGGAIRRSARASARMKSKQEGQTTTGRKRKVSPIVPDSVKKTTDVNVAVLSNDRELDRYCWICHLPGEGMTCSSCPRMYHNNHIKGATTFNAEGLCPECQLTSIDGMEASFSLESDSANQMRSNKNGSDSMLTRLLKHALDRMLTNEGILKSWPKTDDDHKLTCIMDLSKLTDRLNDEIFQYTKTAQFYSDIKWIFHNCMIVHGANHVMTASAKRVLTKMKEELRNIEACPECYESANSNDEQFFIRVCNVKHALVWAKLKGYRYWPAKCLRVLNGKADVRFFKTHDKGSVIVNKCYLLSKDSPDGGAKSFEYQEAMKEMNRYLQNYKAKFGAFPYAPVRTIFDPKVAESGNKDKLKKGTPNKKARRGRSGSLRKEAEKEISGGTGVSTESMDVAETTVAISVASGDVTVSAESMDVGEATVTTSEPSVPEVPVAANESLSETDEIEIIHEVRKRSFLEDLSLSSVELQDTEPVKRARTHDENGLDRSMESGETNPVSVCMTFSTDEDESTLPNEVPSDPLLVTISSPPLRGQDKNSEDNQQIPSSEISETMGYVVTDSQMDPEVAGKVSSSALLPQPLTVSADNRFVSKHIHRISSPSCRAKSPPVQSPIRIVDSGTVRDTGEDIIHIEASSDRDEASQNHEEATAETDSADEVQICEYSGPNTANASQNKPKACGAARGKKYDEKISDICNQASKFMQDLITRVWTVGMEHQEAIDVRKIMNRFEESYREREAALARVWREKEARMQQDFEEQQVMFKVKEKNMEEEHNKVCQNLKKKIDDIELILRNTQEELNKTCGSQLELARKEWEKGRESKDSEIESKEKDAESKFKEVESKMKEMELKLKEIEAKEKEVEAKGKEVEAKEKEFEAKRKEVEAKKKEVEAKEKEVEAKEKGIRSKRREVKVKEKEVESKDKTLENKINERLELQQVEFQAKLKEAKRKEWCTNCLVEAKFRCCWNTNYCGQECQLQHWPVHHVICESVNDHDTPHISLTVSKTVPNNGGGRRNFPAILCRVNGAGTSGTETVSGNSIQVVHRMQSASMTTQRMVRAPVCFPSGSTVAVNADSTSSTSTSTSTVALNENNP